MLFLPVIQTWCSCWILSPDSGHRFLVDTEASVSVFPQATATASAPASSTHLLTAGGPLSLALEPAPSLSSLAHKSSPGPSS